MTDLASSLAGIRSSLESVICSFPSRKQHPPPDSCDFPSSSPSSPLSSSVLPNTSSYKHTSPSSIQSLLTDSLDSSADNLPQFTDPLTSIENVSQVATEPPCISSDSLSQLAEELASFLISSLPVDQPTSSESLSQLAEKLTSRLSPSSSLSPDSHVSSSEHLSQLAEQLTSFCISSHPSNSLESLSRLTEKLTSYFQSSQPTFDSPTTFENLSHFTKQLSLCLNSSQPTDLPSTSVQNLCQLSDPSASCDNSHPTSPLYPIPSPASSSHPTTSFSQPPTDPHCCPVVELCELTQAPKLCDLTTASSPLHTDCTPACLPPNSTFSTPAGSSSLTPAATDTSDTTNISSDISGACSKLVFVCVFVYRYSNHIETSVQVCGHLQTVEVEVGLGMEQWDRQEQGKGR